MDRPRVRRGRARKVARQAGPPLSRMCCPVILAVDSSNPYPTEARYATGLHSRTRQRVDAVGVAVRVGTRLRPENSRFRLPGNLGGAEGHLSHLRAEGGGRHAE